MDITLKAEIKEVTRGLTRLQKKQIPFATSGALNDVAATAAGKGRLKSPFSLPNMAESMFTGGAVAGTKSGFLYGKSHKTRLTSYVYAKDYLNKYLKYQVLGGVRTPDGSSKVMVPTKHSPKNQKGNITRGNLKKFFNNETKYFTGIPKGFSKDETMNGVWQRYGGKKSPKIKMIARFVDSVNYNPKFPIVNLVSDVVMSRNKTGFRSRFEVWLKLALRTAK